MDEMEAERKRGERNAREAAERGNKIREREWTGYKNGILVAMNARRRWDFSSIKVYTELFGLSGL
jgi:hypothetical protein